MLDITLATAVSTIFGVVCMSLREWQANLLLRDYFRFSISSSDSSLLNATSQLSNLHAHAQNTLPSSCIMKQSPTVLRNNYCP